MEYNFRQFSKLKNILLCPSHGWASLEALLLWNYWFKILKIALDFPTQAFFQLIHIKTLNFYRNFIIQYFLDDNKSKIIKKKRLNPAIHFLKSIPLFINILDILQQLTLKQLLPGKPSLALTSLQWRQTFQLLYWKNHNTKLCPTCLSKERLV